MKSFFTVLIFTNILFANTGASLYAKCTGCHGTKGENSALGKSAVIGGQSTKKTIAQLIDYKYGTLDLYGMGSLMQGQVASMSTSDIAAVAVYIKNLKKENSVKNASELSLSLNNFENAEKAYKNNEYGKAVTIFKELCNNRNVKACRKVGHAYKYGYTTHGIKDMKQSSKYFEKALSLLKHSCIDKKEKQACNKLGDMYGIGYLAKKDLSQAIKYNQRACNLGDGEACLRLSSSAKSKKESKKYKKKAITAYKSSCKKGELESCSNLGKLYCKSKNQSAAFDLYSKACASGYEYSCNGLNDMYRNISTTYMVAKGLCNNQGYEVSCDELKKMKRKKINSFLPKIINVLKKSCSQSSQNACAALSNIASYLDFHNNPKKSKELYTYACENKYEQGCSKVNTVGQGMQLGKMSAKVKSTNSNARSYSDMRSYCEKAAGGSYVLMELCIEQESAARDRLGY